MSEEQKTEPTAKTGEAWYWNDLKAEQRQAFDATGLNRDKLSEEERAEIAAMTVEEIGKYLKWADKFAKRVRWKEFKDGAIIEACRVAVLIGMSFFGKFCIDMSKGPWHEYTVVLWIWPILTAAAIAFYVYDKFYPEFSFSVWLKTRPEAVSVLTICVTMLICTAVIAAAGSITVGSGTPSDPAEPQHDQSATTDSLTASQRESFNVLHGINPEWREGNEPQAQRNSGSGKEKREQGAPEKLQ